MNSVTNDEPLVHEDTPVGVSVGVNELLPHSYLLQLQHQHPHQNPHTPLLLQQQQLQHRQVLHQQQLHAQHSQHAQHAQHSQQHHEHHEHHHHSPSQQHQQQQHHHQFQQLPQLSQQLPHHYTTAEIANPQLNHQIEMLTHQVKHDELIDGNSKKVAPRSSDLFKIGPQFGDTRHHQNVFLMNNMPVQPILNARIDRGFDLGENDVWIGYKRNYFTLVASFEFANLDFQRFMQHKFYIYEKMKSPTEQKVEISYFAVRLVAKCSDEEVNISLIQHTPKRDKGPQFPPPIYPTVPGTLPDHATVKISSNKRNATKLENLNKIFYFDRAEYYRNAQLNNVKDQSILKNYPSDSIAKVARFERIQFSSSIRVKSSSVNNKYFTLNVELLGIIEDEESHIQPILLSSIESPPLIIRGRSPSNYEKKPPRYRPLLDQHLQERISPH